MENLNKNQILKEITILEDKAHQLELKYSEEELENNKTYNDLIDKADELRDCILVI